ncbi:MAG TPA: cell division protein FtsH, partial [Blastocatellia bacterium]|nr:cell division protein FtsH [Blastocatellia bacterium]
IDQEVKRIVMDQYERARKIMLDNKESTEKLALALLERETLDAVQIRRIVAGLPLDDNTPSPTPSADNSNKPADKEPVLKPILPPITGGNPAPA